MGDTSNSLRLHPRMELAKWIFSYFGLPDPDMKGNIEYQKLQINLDSMKKELASMTGINKKKDEEVERLTAELNALRIELATCKGLLEEQTTDYNEKVEDLKLAEDEIDELKNLLDIAKAIRRKSVAQLAKILQKKISQPRRTRFLTAASN